VNSAQAACGHGWALCERCFAQTESAEQDGSFASETVHDKGMDYAPRSPCVDRKGSMPLTMRTRAEPHLELVAAFAEALAAADDSKSFSWGF